MLAPNNQKHDRALSAVNPTRPSLVSTFITSKINADWVEPIRRDRYSGPNNQAARILWVHGSSFDLSEENKLRKTVKQRQPNLRVLTQAAPKPMIVYL